MSHRRRKKNRGKQRYQAPTEVAAPPVSETPEMSTQPLLADISQGFSSIVRVAFDVLANPDIAVRTDERLQRQMIRDPMLMAPLRKRMLATAQLDWQIEAEDPEDEAQVKVAEFVANKITNIPNRIDLNRDLLWATWRGTGVSELNWFQEPDNSWGINGHVPHHGDKILYTRFGDVRLRTRDKQIEGRELDQGELDRLIIHTFDRDDGEFLDGAEAGYVFKGRGLRDLCWQYWWLKHNALKFWLSYLEHKGTGWLTGKYPMGNAAAKTAIESVLQNLTQNSKVSIPVPPNLSKDDIFEIQNIADTDRQGTSKMFMEFVDDFCGKHLRILIEGQQQANQESGDGLGSGRANALQDIFTMIRNYDATSLAQTLTDSLVKRLVFFNFGNVPFKLKFKFITEDRAADMSERVSAAKEAGLEVGEGWIYDGLGIPIPTEDEKTVQLGAAPVSDGISSPGGGPLGFSEPRSTAAQVYDCPSLGRYRDAFNDIESEG